MKTATLMRHGGPKWSSDRGIPTASSDVNPFRWSVSHLGRCRRYFSMDRLGPRLGRVVRTLFRSKCLLRVDAAGASSVDDLEGGGRECAGASTWR